LKLVARTLSLFIVFVVTAAIFSGTAFAQGAGGASSDGAEQVFIKVGIIDIDGVRANSKAVQDIHKQITKYRDQIQSSIQKEEKELRKANDELARQRTILSPDAFEVERAKFEKRFAELQKRVQQSKQSLAKVQAEANEKVDKVILEAIQKIIVDEGYTLILKKSATVASASALDLTGDILAILDKELPSVKVSDPTK